MQIKVKALGPRNKTVIQVVLSGALDSFMNFYCGLKLMAEL